MSTRTQRRRIQRISVSDDPAAGSAGPLAGARADLLAVEEPLEIRIGGQPLTVTMRTPGDDIDLAAGFLFTEGLLFPEVDLRQIRMCDENVADATLEVADLPSAAEVQRATDARRAQQTAQERAQRNFLTTSACGVCGKESIDAIRVRSRYDLTADQTQVSPVVLAGLPDRLREAQRVFASTGGLHAAGLFSTDGSLAVLREDVGRHNAVDKVIGWALRAGRLPARGHILMVSGRASFELVQKAAVAGLPVLAAVSAPSSLAADLAEETGMTLVGFLRGNSMNAYTGLQRLTGITTPA
ncbi:MAG TPA: formate dehydrogenase accessory sulfurtransferase FdhD [Streptosporangiaceae bacterium]